MSFSDDHILYVNQLKAGFEGENGFITAVNDVSFTLRKGETLGIVGESGSGKSVTALSLLKLIPEPPGKIMGGTIMFNSSRYGWLDIVKAKERVLVSERGNEIAMIFQEPMTSLNPVFTCGRQVQEVIMLHQNLSAKQAKERTIELFKEVELPRPEEIFTAYPHQISGGQKQRVMIAMAISCEPALLICDEPTTALDVTVQAKILELINKLKARNNMSVIFISHDLGVIADVADRILVMYHGNIVEQGTLWEIYSNPLHPYTKGLLACRPRMDMKLQVLPTVSDFMPGQDSEETEKKSHKYSSVGEALLFNFITDEDLQARKEKLLSLEPLLKVSHLKTYFPVYKGIFKKVINHVKAVDDVTFDVKRGETMGLVGESGCGKTTLGRSIMRLIEPTEGEIFLEGNNILDLRKGELQKLRRQIQIIFQDPYSSLNPRMTIGDAIVEPMKYNDILNSDFARRKRAVELLERVSLKPEYYNRYPHEFSGGQRQRICIARALALEPRFIILDESVSALDVSVQAQVLNLLNKLKEDFGYTFIFISHNLAVVKFIADRVLIMRNGKIVESGFAEEVYENPKEAYTKTLIQSIPTTDLEEIRRRLYRKGIKVK